MKLKMRNRRSITIITIVVFLFLRTAYGAWTESVNIPKLEKVKDLKLVVSLEEDTTEDATNDVVEEVTGDNKKNKTSKNAIEDKRDNAKYHDL